MQLVEVAEDVRFRGAAYPRLELRDIRAGGSPAIFDAREVVLGRAVEKVVRSVRRKVFGVVEIRGP
jgi:hypothetical protein